MSFSSISNGKLKHIAIVMDGNGRWAKSQQQEREFGHNQGVDNAIKIVKYANKIKLPYLSLFCFSSENWFRPTAEVNFLISLIMKNIDEMIGKLSQNDINFGWIGNKDRLPITLIDKLQKCCDATNHCQGTKVILAIDYGGKFDILQATKNIAIQYQQSNLNLDQITEESFDNYLLTKDIPDPDLLIRTGREQRISNFYLWQAAYSEIIFSSSLWPEFNEDNLTECIKKYELRKRKYGRIVK